jgi:hypothetical protein
MACNKEGSEAVNITDRHESNLKQVTKFKYLESDIEEIGTAVKERIKAAWKKWRDLTRILYDKKCHGN